ncbi:MAG TPA: aminotransferase class I/II-fold pyridoxal phosphate-dependent enzyme [Clostridiaceae bacterium]|nr:aminotransferase class I/II-fold pyridoxal phosphate-dependent enzyme [Clostridiaceae bacterium]
MTDYTLMSKGDLQKNLQILIDKYNKFKAQNLNLDMSRGKPCPEQLELSKELLEIKDYKASDGTDCRNYGALDGIPEAKKLFSEYLEVNTDEIIIQGNSSLNLMYDTINRAMTFGVDESSTPWSKLPAVKFICPSPGYDRHFAICELFNIEMIAVDMHEDGPDMDKIESLVAEDESIKGIWCVPKYSNPQGYTYSDETVDRLASMKTKAKDFRIFWDNAYAVHHLSEKHDNLKNILTACKKYNNPDRVYIFSSTSKITYAGAGISMLASSKYNIDRTKKLLSIQTIGYDKMNQLRHVLFLKNMDNIHEHMKKHASILKPKFDTVLNILERELGSKNICSWTKPNGGYFISFDTMDGCAKKVVKMASEAGVKLTSAGATFPYGKDPRDRNIRIAPSYPPISELKQAIELFCVCVQIASIEKLLLTKD